MINFGYRFLVVSRFQVLCGCLITLILEAGLSSQCYAEESRIPVIEGPWVQIAGNPDLGELTGTQQQPVDFGIWQAADGTWQLWSCIRATKETGKSRLFHRWEGKNLTDANWTPMGVAMRADPRTGELSGGLQAPYVFRNNGQHVMFYGGWDDICSATSQDGKTFVRKLNADGKVTLFRNRDEAQQNPRDAMLIRTNGLWHCYYTSHAYEKSVVYCRTSTDLNHWGEEHVVAAGGKQSGDGNSACECPFVVELEPGEYYLFRTQVYGTGAQTCVYRSTDPLNFGIHNDEGHFVCKLPVAAPEIIKHEGQYYIAALLPSLKGIQVAPLKWKKTP